MGASGASLHVMSPQHCSLLALTLGVLKAPQLRQLSPCEAERYCPFSHILHVEAPEAEYESHGHWVQLFSLTVSEKEPVGHTRQCPGPPEYPGGQ